MRSDDGLWSDLWCFVVLSGAAAAGTPPSPSLLYTIQETNETNLTLTQCMPRPYHYHTQRSGVNPAHCQLEDCSRQQRQAGSPKEEDVTPFHLAPTYTPTLSHTHLPCRLEAEVTKVQASRAKLQAMVDALDSARCEPNACLHHTKLPHPSPPLPLQNQTQGH